MSYVEHCDQHGQYHGEYCGECVEAMQVENARLREALEEITKVTGPTYGLAANTMCHIAEKALNRSQQSNYCFSDGCKDPSTCICRCHNDLECPEGL